MLNPADTALHFFTDKEQKLFTYKTAFGLTIITEKVFSRCCRGCRRRSRPPRRAPTSAVAAAAAAAVFNAAATVVASPPP